MKIKVIEIFGIMFFVVNFMLLFSVQASAYIDPSVMTYAIQAIAGVAIAVGTFVGIYWKKAKKKINKKLNIDENKNKEVETDEIVIKKKANNK